MLRNTHIAAGISAALILIRPQGLLPVASTALLATCGAVISDIDADRSWSKKKADVIVSISAATVAAFVMIAAVSAEPSDMIRSIGAAKIIGKLAAWILAVFLCSLGMKQEHRRFMHSLAAGAMLTVYVYRVFSRESAFAFLVGFLSHLALDLLNHKDMQLFWPIKKGICLHACASDGIINKVLGTVFLVTSVLLFDVLSGIGLCRLVEGLV